LWKRQLGCQRERVLQVDLRALDRAPVGGDVRGTAQVFDRASPVAALLEMVCDFGSGIIQYGGEHVLEPLGAPPMEYGTTGRRLSLVEGTSRYNACVNE
jgi:hypothetical protein